MGINYNASLWVINYNASPSQIVKFQNKAVRITNDVLLMESITPHYVSLSRLKFPDIVKGNSCRLFHDYFQHEKFPNIPVSLKYLSYIIIIIPAVHHLIKYM